MLAVVAQLQGLELPAGSWEATVLPARVAGYDPRWLDELCLSGEVAWGRLTPRPERDHEGRPRRGAATPSPSTPLSLVLREDLAWLLRAVRGRERPASPSGGAAADVFGALEARGASFRAELTAATRRLPGEVDEGLWDLVARGLVTADAFSAVRGLLARRARRRTRPAGGPGRARGAAARRALAAGGEGRWSLLGGPDPDLAGEAAGDGTDPWEAGGDELAEAVAWQLLNRWGVVMWELWGRESFRLPWRLVVRALRRLEARGQVVGGRYVAGLAGEQYALPEAARVLTEVRRSSGAADELAVAGADPLNLTGSVVPGPRVPAVRHRTVVYRGGVPVHDGAG